MTLEAYGRDARQFLDFLAERFGAPPTIADFVDLAPADLRAFLARRRAEGDRRALAAARALGAALAGAAPRARGRRPRLGLGACARRGRRAACPARCALADAKAVATTAPRDGEARDPWILARDAAVLALCYGAGLRISEALSIRRARCADRRRRRR